MDSATFVPLRSSQPPSGRPFTLRMGLRPGTPMNFTPLTPVSYLLRSALIAPQARALVHPERGYAFNYAQWAARCLSLTHAIQSAPSFKPGTPVAVIAPNCPLILEAHNAVLAAGGVVLPINMRNTPAEISYVLEHSCASLILVDHAFAHLVEPHHSNERGLTVVVSHDTGGAEGLSVDPYEQFLDQGWLLWQQANDQAAQRARYQGRDPTNAPRDWENILLPESEDAGSSLCYTSGTTGRPKGVLTTLRGSYLAALANAFEMRMDQKSVYLWVLPAFHASGWTYPWAVTAALACHYTLRRVDYGAIWEAYLHGGITHACGAPTVQVGIVSHPAARNVSTPARPVIRIGVAGSAPTASLLGKMESLGFAPVHLYGMTETYGPFTRRYDDQGGVGEAWRHLPLDQRARLMAQQGHGFLTADEVRVFRIPKDFDGDWSKVKEPAEDVAMDGKEVGEVVMRGNIVMKEYYNDPKATAKSSKDGYLCSGDLAVRLPGGAIAMRDRSKDIVISGGENISTTMVEQELSAHNLVRECAMVARPHPRWGEAGHACVVLTPLGLRTYLGKMHADAKAADRPLPALTAAQVPEAEADSHDKGLAAACEALNSSLDWRLELTQELRAWCRDRMSPFAVPAWIELVPYLPKVPTGKVQKNVLREMVRKHEDHYPVPLDLVASSAVDQPLASAESGFVPGMPLSKI